VGVAMNVIIIVGVAIHAVYVIISDGPVRDFVDHLIGRY